MVNIKTHHIVANVLTIGFLLTIGSLAQPNEETTNGSISDKDLECLVSNIYHEARGESPWGMVAVGYVTMNRAKYHHKSVCDVVWEPHQFSWTSDGRPDTMDDVMSIKKSVDIALLVAKGKVRNPIGNALNYYAHNKVKPYWANNAKEYIIVDNHTFLTLGKGN